jgi:hypothetical protein
MTLSTRYRPELTVSGVRKESWGETHRLVRVDEVRVLDVLVDFQITWRLESEDLDLCEDSAMSRLSTHVVAIPSI